jgi:hypothetical protein
MNTEVYSWRVSSALKSDLQAVARLRKVPLSTLLDLAAREWLRNVGPRAKEGEEQRRLHEAADQCLGTFESGDSKASENTGQQVRDRLLRRHGR